MTNRVNINALLSQLREAGITIQVVNDTIHLKYPKGAMTSSLTERIKENKEEIIGYLKNINHFSAGNNQIPKAAPAELYPLSSSQQRLWVIYAMNTDSRAYNIPYRFQLIGRVDPVLYKKAGRAVVERHEILRTVFVEKNGVPGQLIIPFEQTDFDIECIDVRQNDNKKETVESIIAVDAAKPFDLGNFPLFRIILFQLNEEEHLLYFNIHHIISDGWSMNLLVRDLNTFYEAFAKNESPALPPLRIQYKDYAVWQQQQLLTGTMEVSRSYWKQQLSGELPVMTLPVYKPRPQVLTGNGRQLMTMIDEALSNKLREFVAARDGTLYMGLMAVLKSLLYRYTGQEDIIIGSPVAGRDHADLEEQLGFYINTLPLRTKFSGSDSFTELFGKIKEVTLGAYQHQQYPFDRLVDDLALRRTMNRSPVFDIVLVIQNQNYRTVIKTTDWPGENQVIDQGACDIKIDCVFSFSERTNGILLTAEYNTDIYDTEMMTALLKHYKKLMAAILANPSRPIAMHQYLSEQECSRLLHDFNPISVDHYRNLTVIDLFRAQVKKTPGNTAVVFEDEQISYSELDAKSNQLANYLLRKGVKKGAVIPVCLDRSIELITALLAVIKTGAAYVPIDPAYPVDRINYMLNDIKAATIISDTRYKDFFVEQREVFKVYLDRDWIAVEREPIHEISVSIVPADLVYVIYTSGSTGKPKGVMIEHGGLVNLVYGQTLALGLREKLCLLQFASISFDASCYEIFNSLLTGGCLAIPSGDTIIDLPLLSALIDKHRIEIAIIPPSYLALVKELIGKFKTVVSGGEALNPEMAKWIMAQGVHLFNAYGPTETTVCATITDRPLLENNLVTIGKPVMNTACYILDVHMNLVPAGVTGELFIGGVQLARGYLNRQELTNERFLDNPFRPGERLYRTGDLARWLPDGNIEFMGRIDEQVKIRGFRIEPGEIEHCLATLPGIQSCVVTAQQRAQGDKYLVAYFTSSVRQDTALLRQHVKEQLPEYMVPGHFVQLNVLPLTANGKIDKKALPDPDSTRAGAYEAPVKESEMRLTALIASLLKKEESEIGIEDNFFEMGMDSLLLIRTSVLINKEFKTNMKVNVLFTWPNIKALAENYLDKLNEMSPVSQEPAAGSEEDLTDVFDLFEEK